MRVVCDTPASKVKYEIHNPTISAFVIDDMDLYGMWMCVEEAIWVGEMPPPVSGHYTFVEVVRPSEL